MYGELSLKLSDLRIKIENMSYELEAMDDYCCDIEDGLEDNDIDVEALKEIIKQVEYKTTNWRKLDTAEDVVKAIRKEVLGE